MSPTLLGGQGCNETLRREVRLLGRGRVRGGEGGTRHHSLWPNQPRCLISQLLEALGLCEASRQFDSLSAAFLRALLSECSFPRGFADE